MCAKDASGPNGDSQPRLALGVGDLESESTATTSTATRSTMMPQTSSRSVAAATWPPIGVKPYYLDESCCIIHGDCREILPYITADVLVTDPPYGVSFNGKATKHTKAAGGYLGVDDPEVGPVAVHMALERVTRGAVFSGIRGLHDYPKPRDIGCVYCPSGAGRGPWGFTCFNPVLFYGTRPGGPTSPSSIESFETVEERGHPCPKPDGWMRWLIALTSLPGDLVLDPFMGSGTTLRAAKDLGRRAIGIEIEERYCEIAVRRLAQRVLAL